MILLIVRRSEGELFRYLRSTFAEHPVVITWDRRFAERRHNKRFAGDRRQRERRNSSGPGLDTVPFLAVPLSGRPYRLAS